MRADAEPTEKDRDLGDELAEEIGDTLLDSPADAPEQWTQIVKLLRLNGYKIVEFNRTSESSE